MKRSKLIGLCLVAVFAMGTAVVSTAMATEPFFEVKEGGALPLKGTVSLPEGKLLVPAIGIEIVCKSGSGSGEIFNDAMTVASLEKTTVKFVECTLVGSTCEINGKAAGKGEIEATGIKGMLGYAPGKTGKENVRFELESENAEGVFTSIKFSGSSCSLKNENVKITKGVIGAVPAADIETPLSEATLELGVVNPGTPEEKQELTEIELPVESLKLLLKNELKFGSHPSAIKDKATLKLEAGHKVEIKL